ncbi:XRE family transcriptional regulator [Pseudooceanicola sp. CBS1P-1]|uniref:Cupin domain-containing protein n=1 Tax=Pseudooceanicola albus TaxID=2692189 RepID=A0A6L7G3Z8_9RHOB|nr:MULTISPECIES: XRE family transcriptional regulator [Pseudooceanicola]MBT9385306.1 XRE family transcriptional regulator [Pseudooceanicola endophyticus]MXN18835.1 cupin domain-containing protein [Pseudooceanicola albus]
MAPEPADTAGSVGDRLRRRRQELKLTMKQVAEAAGFSIGYISQIERGLTTPSLTALGLVAEALDAPLADFFTQPAAAGPVTRQGNRATFSVGLGQGTVYERLSAAFPGNVLRSVIMHEAPGHRSDITAHDGEEIFYIVEGALTIEVAGETYVLNKGDSIHFKSSLPHVSWNHTTEPTAILHTCTIDVFGDDRHPHAPSGDRLSLRRAGKKAQTITPAQTGQGTLDNQQE